MGCVACVSAPAREAGGTTHGIKARTTSTQYQNDREIHYQQLSTASPHRLHPMPGHGVIRLVGSFIGAFAYDLEASTLVEGDCPLILLVDV